MENIRDAESRERAERLRAAGLRVTAPRLAILEALEIDRRHPTAELLYESLREQWPSLSLSTVYATMESFLHTGIIRRIGGTTGKLRVDGTAPDHDHAICRSCGEVFDVPRDLIRRPKAPEKLPKGLTVTSLHLEYEVVCSPCSRNA